MPVRSTYTAVTLAGDLIAPELLDRVATGIELDGAKPADYGAIGRRSVADDAERAWDYLKAAWTDLRETIPASAEPKDPTGAARRSWIEPLFDELGFGRLASTGGGIDSDDGSKTFPISNQWTHVPIHITDWATGLEDRMQGQAAPHSLVQECLNTTSGHLWGMTTNGRHLRLLRDSTAIAGTAYVEFDLETIFDNELVNEFVLLYRLLHVSRFEVADDAAPSACWLEKWRTSAIQAGMRALDQMKAGVQEAITVLGTGYLSHPDNGHLIDYLDAEQFHRALLRLTYRLLFLFVIEDKGVLHAPDADEKAKERYRKYYSTTRLRAHARRRRGTSHGDLYQGLRLVLDALGSEGGQEKLALPGLGGIFDQTDADEILDGLAMSNAHLLRAVRALAVVRDKKTRRNRAIDYRHLDAEELGSVYESLLELVPKYSAMERRFELVNLAGNQRKTTGSYYTPSNLIERLLDTTLDPVIDAAVKRGEERGGLDSAQAIEKELLSLTVCDPACGSGHFLVAGARRIAKKLAAVREHNPEPTPGALSSALREVVGRCIYGVDLNPMAVELAKVSLWLEAMEPGKALGFLDAHIKCGNSLIGAYPALMAKGIPDGAWKPIEGDDSAFAAKLLKRNAQERMEREHAIEGAEGLFDIAGAPFVSNTKLAMQLQRITGVQPDELGRIRKQASQFREFDRSAEVMKARALADAWCAAFFWPKYQDAPLAPTDAVFRELERGGFDTLRESAVIHEATELRDRYRFFHWYVEFPGIFNVPEPSEVKQTDELTGWNGGFDCVIGNPPWDKVDFEDKKYFSVVEPEIAEVPGRARKQRIAEWEAANPSNGAKYRAAIRDVKGRFRFAGTSGVFPLCQRGLTVKGVNSLNTDQLFMELFRNLGSGTSRFGAIIPSNIATGAGAQHLFADFTGRGSLVSLYDFENAQEKFFPGVHSSQRFCLFTASGRGIRIEDARFAFFLNEIDQIDDLHRTYNLSPEELKLISPNTGTLPIFRDRRDAAITAGVFKKVPVLWNEAMPGGNPWEVRFKNLFNMTDDSDLFKSREELEGEGWQLRRNIFELGHEQMLPLYEAKMVSFFDSRAADVVKSETAVTRQNQPRYLTRAEKQDPTRYAMPLHWVPESEVSKELDAVGYEQKWLIGWCDVTSATNERTAIPALIPRTAVGHTFPLVITRQPADRVAGLLAAQSSFIFDYISRQKVSDAHMKLFLWKQLPVPHPDSIRSNSSFLQPRMLELVYSVLDMKPFSEDLGDSGEPFVWDEGRRFAIRAELDAFFFRFYGIERDDVDYIMETFPGVKNKDEANFGSYRTKELILEIYDEMAAAGVSAENPPIDGESFFSRLTPPPGEGPRHAPRGA